MSCPVCGGTGLQDRRVLWPALVAEWQLAPEEHDYVDRQQGTHCPGCGANLRSMALARAILRAAGAKGLLQDFVESSAAAGLRLIEINDAGSLGPTLARLPGRRFGAYPELDMHDMPFPDGSFDLVVHSDTLEHVEQPVRALAECRRVLAPGGALCFTIPVIVGRLSRGRAGLPPSYHGNPETDAVDWAVQTEFGADMWTYAMRAGFRRIEIFAEEYPAALAMTAWRD